MEEIEAALRERPGQTAWELTVGLTWSRPWDEIPGFMQRAANGETLAHLVVLERHDHVRRGRGSPVRWSLGDAAT
jgi:hypothetical protein